MVEIDFEQENEMESELDEAQKKEEVKGQSAMKPSLPSRRDKQCYFVNCW